MADETNKPGADSFGETLLEVAVPDAAPATATVSLDHTRRDTKLQLPNPDLTTLSLDLTVGEEIGRGGMGRILLGHDSGIGREVALKSPHASSGADARALANLLREVRITGQLEHPNIVPIYRLDRLPDGSLYFAMKRIRGRSLAQVLAGLARNNPQTVAQFRLLDCLRIFMQVCLAVDFAHARGVIHRDIKPENIMLGDYGEVLLMDWGAALVRSDVSEHGQAIDLNPPDSREDGYIVGTPAYMPPEQARGKVSQTDRRSDVYALGATLYEILTLTPPILEREVFQALDAVLDGNIEPPALRSPERDIAPELDDICLTALTFDPDERYTDARELHNAVQAFFEGTLASERRHREALHHIELGDLERRHYRAIDSQRETVEREMQILRTQIAGNNRQEERHKLWNLEDRLQAAERDLAWRFSKTLNLYLMAERLEPSNREAKARLGELYWSRYLEAERKGQIPAMITWEAQLRRVDDGRFSEQLKGEGQITIESDPAGAQVAIARLTERSRRLVPEPPKLVTASADAVLRLPHGPYQLTLTFPDHAPAIVPLNLERMETLLLSVRLYPVADIAPGFIHIPAGPVPIGGDPDTFGAFNARTADLPDFALARHPVTVADYLTYLNDRAYHTQEEAHRHAPRDTKTGTWYLREDEAGLFHIPEADAEGHVWQPGWPVLGVSFDDAEAYAVWRSQREGFRFRLPTEEEWEKAARGADRRRYPWGNSFDPSFCNMRDSFDDFPHLDTVDAFPVDRSPYGILGMAGNMRDWTLGTVDEATTNITVRGGAWSMYEIFSRCTCRAGAPRELCAVNIGFRLVQELKSENASTSRWPNGATCPL